MAAAVGVHLGNTAASVAVSKSGRTSVVANSHGDRLTPAVVTFLEGEAVVGYAAKPRNVTVRHVVRLLEARADENGKNDLIQAGNAEGTGVKITKKNGDVSCNVNIGGKSKLYSPADIAQFIFADLLKTAQSQVGANTREVVLAAPAAVLPSYHHALTEAACSAGFEVLRVISNPAAAAIAYEIGTKDHIGERYNVLVFRVGGMTQDVTVLQVCSGIISSKHHVGVDGGGDILTGVLAEYFASLFERKFKVSVKLDAKAMNKLKIQADKCKHVLSTVSSASLHIDSLYDGLDFNCDMSRSRFELLVGDHLQKLLLPIKELLESGLDKTTIRKVIMCGGTCKIPRLQNLVAELLPGSEILCSIPPEEVIAVGTAIEANILQSSSKLVFDDKDCQMTFSPINLFLSVFDTTMLLVAAWSALPANIVKEIAIPVNVDSCVVELLSAHEVNATHKEKVADISLQEITSGSTLVVRVNYLVSGHLVFTCTDVHSKLSKSVTLTT